MFFGTNLRRVLPLFCSFLHCSSSIAQVQPVLYDCTGATSVSIFDIQGCYTLPATAAGFQAVPAPFGVANLSYGGVLLPWADYTFILEGGSGGGWTDIAAYGIRLIPVTHRFTLGVRTRFSVQGATGFTAIQQTDVGIQSRIVLDSVFFLSVQAAGLLSYSSAGRSQPRILTTGIGMSDDISAAINLCISPAQPPSLVLAVLTPLPDAAMVRLALQTEPLAFSIGVRLSVIESPVMAFQLTRYLHSGFVSQLVVEL